MSTSRWDIRINQGGTVIDPLEARILRAKKSAIAIATRIITRGGTGHEYWKHFTDAKARERTPNVGGEIYKLLFFPTLEMPIKTPDIPLAGFGYGSGVLRLAFDIVGLANGLPVPDSTRAKGDETQLQDDQIGTETLEYLTKARRVVKLILSNEPLSLGLHPALYFYTAGGTFQAPALLNCIAWFLDLEKRGKIQQFLKVRGAFENLMISHPAVIKPATHKLGSGSRTRSKMLELFERALELLSANKDPARAWKRLVKEFPYLAADEEEQVEAAHNKGKSGGKFSRSTKSAASLSDLSNIQKCVLCGGLLHKNGKVVDHKEPRSGRGSSASANARWVHPACNSNRQAMKK